jgi:hypothetical protein
MTSPHKRLLEARSGVNPQSPAVLDLANSFSILGLVIQQIQNLGQVHASLSVVNPFSTIKITAPLLLGRTIIENGMQHATRYTTLKSILKIKLFPPQTHSEK